MRIIAVIISALVMAGCQPADTSVSLEITTDSRFVPAGNAWYTDGQKSVQEQAARLAHAGIALASAKNVILFVGDGMSMETIAAARILEGQRAGENGEENRLSFEHFPFTGLSKTYNVDAQTPDSAGTMTAMTTGVKTDMGIVGQDETASRSLCDPSGQSDVATLIELAEIAGLSSGIVTTARLTHATPAATYAHAPDRNWEDVSDMPEEALVAGCVDIAAQFVGFPDTVEKKYGVPVDGIDVAFGGGRRHFLPKDPQFNTADAQSSTEGDRTDGRDLISEWQSKHGHGHVVMADDEFKALTVDTQGAVLGLFSESHMRFEADRKNDVAGEPNLVAMTEKAIQLLSRNEQGFLLMVESGRIDHAHHAGNAYNALNETIVLSDAVRRATELTDPSDTLIIVTSDHGHVMSFAGYPKRGNPILGKVVNPGQEEPAEAADGLPYTTLSYANGMGMDVIEGDDPEERYNGALNAGRQDIRRKNTESPHYHQEALVSLYSETHSGEDVAIYANGPSAALVSGVHEQNDIFHMINRSVRLTEKASEKLPPSVTDRSVITQ